MLDPLYVRFGRVIRKNYFEAEYYYANDNLSPLICALENAESKFEEGFQSAPRTLADLDSCLGHGVCALLPPGIAISSERFEYDSYRVELKSLDDKFRTGHISDGLTIRSLLTCMIEVLYDFQEHKKQHSTHTPSLRDKILERRKEG